MMLDADECAYHIEGYEFIGSRDDDYRRGSRDSLTVHDISIL